MLYQTISILFFLNSLTNQLGNEFYCNSTQKSSFYMNIMSWTVDSFHFSSLENSNIKKKMNVKHKTQYSCFKVKKEFIFENYTSSYFNYKQKEKLNKNALNMESNSPTKMDSQIVKPRLKALKPNTVNNKNFLDTNKFNISGRNITKNYSTSSSLFNNKNVLVLYVSSGSVKNTAQTECGLSIEKPCR